MAEVPEMNDLLMDSYSEEEFYSQCSSEMKVDMDHLEWKDCITTQSNCRSGITREIRKPRKPVLSLKKAIKLVVIIGRVSRGKSFEAECVFDDRDLLNHILVEESISFNNAIETCAVAPKFRYSNTTVYTIRDTRQKCLMLQEYQGSAHLVALFLQGNNLDKQAKINMGAYKSSPFMAQTQPVTLGIVGRNLYLSCITEEGEKDPVLSLMETTDILNKKDNDLLPFLFYKRVNGNSSNTFESAAFPGWYLCTSQAENQFVQIKPENDQMNIRELLLQSSS